MVAWGTDAFVKLHTLDLELNRITSAGVATLVAALANGALPAITGLAVPCRGASRAGSDPRG